MPKTSKILIMICVRFCGRSPSDAGLICAEMLVLTPVIRGHAGHRDSFSRDFFRQFKENKDPYNFAAHKIKTTDPLQLQVSLVRLGAGREDHQDKRG
jgi:hypothetical protein